MDPAELFCVDSRAHEHSRRRVTAAPGRLERRTSTPYANPSHVSCDSRSVLPELLRRAHIDSSEINESLGNPLHADQVVACQGALCSLARLLVALSTEADLMKKSLATTFLTLGSILLIVLVYARATDAQGSSGPARSRSAWTSRRCAWI